MKKPVFFILLLALIGSASYTQAQINVGGIIRNRVNNRAAQKVGEATDKALDTMEEAAKQSNAKAPQQTETRATETDEADAPAETSSATAKSAPLKLYSKYDFVPGDRVLFEDDLKGEETGEFPSRWDLVEGNAEIAELNDMKVINFVDAGSEITPLIDKDNYLPETFTIEMDLFMDTHDYYRIALWNDKKGHQEVNGKLDWIKVQYNEVQLVNHNIGSSIPNSEPYAKQGQWRHVAIAFNKRSLKVYLDQHRLLNMPVVEGKPTGLSIEGNHYNSESRRMLVKNIRIAEGGKLLYDRMASEGKIITHGITFDVNKASLRPESMGTINGIVKLMKEQPDLRFSIEGHTDNDGDDASNLKLSRARAEAVKQALVEAGIEGSRLSTKGLGESKPLGPNDSPEGKANNRRVEFVKM